MCSWRSIAVARVFALVVQCRIMRLVLYSRVGKNRDTWWESPAGAGAGRTAGHKTVLFSQKILAVRKGNCIYRFVSCWAFYSLIIYFLNIEINQIIRIKFFSKDNLAVPMVMNS